MHSGSQGGRPWRGGQGGGQQPWAAGGVRSPGHASWQSAPLALTQAWNSPGLYLAQFLPGGGPRGSRQLHHSKKGDPEPLRTSRIPRVPHAFRVCTPGPRSPSDFRVGKHSALVTLEQGLACLPGAAGRWAAGTSQGQRQSWAWTAGSPVPRPLPTPAVVAPEPPPPDPLCWT